MRSILFSPVMLAGGLFLLGVPVSNWWHVIVTAGRTDRRRPRHPRPHRGRSDRQWGYVPLAPARGRGCCDSGGGAGALRVRSGRSCAHSPRCPGWTGWTPLMAGTLYLCDVRMRNVARRAG
jgi:hypothetical protein